MDGDDEQEDRRLRNIEYFLVGVVTGGFGSFAVYIIGWMHKMGMV